MDKPTDLSGWPLDIQKDPVNHPAHYELPNGMECIDAIISTQGVQAARDFCVCNAFKYIWRCRRKNAFAQDLEKARWYISKALELGEA